MTPFGFQSEQRTYWSDTDLYIEMSPFTHVRSLAERRNPILLIHGQNDDNTGTFPIQSERYYAALKGHGAVTRLVMLPFESHAYRARESILHTLQEQSSWLDHYVTTEGAPAEVEMATARM